MTPLTTEQEAEFTIFNAAAFDLYRKEAQEAGETPPCWLCMSNDAKLERKKKFANWFSGAVQVFPPMSVAEAERRVQRDLNGGNMLNLVAKWKAAELEFKRLREDENDPRAFFAD